MNTKRILAVAAVALMAVPAYAAASYIVLPGVTEQIVEGHTVFAVIEKAQFENRTIEAAAVAVLVRERNVVRENFKGVLWFNDQFLVSPYEDNLQNARYPCGGAVIAVNSGDPDPRTMLFAWNEDDQLTEFYQSNGDYNDTLAQDNDVDDADHEPDYNLLGTDAPRYEDPNSAQNLPGTAGYNGAPATPGAYQPLGNAWVDVDENRGFIHTSLPTGVFNYVESYLITDPNDHTWIVDKYNGITVTSVDIATGQVTEQTSTFPIWVVNILGRPAFTIDRPSGPASSCSPYTDDPFQQSRINSAWRTVEDAYCNPPVIGPNPVSCISSPPGAGQDTNGDGLPVDGLDGRPPAIGYFEPTDPATNGGATYCYDGNAPQGTNAGRTPGTGCVHSSSQNPLRLYNAVLYFYLGPDDVYITAYDVAHGDTDTNGCESTPTYSGHHTAGPKAATEWLCPGGDDNAEGNSHPFNPPGIYVPTAFDPTTGAQIPGTGEYIDIWADNRECSTGRQYDGGPCNPEEHVAHNRGLVDLYFSPTARPLEPGLRDFVVLDYEGSTDQFHENDQPQPRLHPGV